MGEMLIGAKRLTVTFYDTEVRFKCSLFVYKNLNVVANVRQRQHSVTAISLSIVQSSGRLVPRFSSE